MKGYIHNNKKSDASKLSAASKLTYHDKNKAVSLTNNRPESIVQKKINEIADNKSGRFSSLVPGSDPIQRVRIFNSQGGLVAETDNYTTDQLYEIEDGLRLQNENAAAAAVMQVIFDREDIQSSED